MTEHPTKMATFRARFRQWQETYFPDRQLFLRSQGRVRFLTIHSYTQMGISAGLIVAFGWGMVTSYAYLTRDNVIEGKNQTISTMSSQYKTLSGDFSALEAEVERRAALLEERQQFLENILQGEIEQADVPGDTPTSASDSAGEPAETNLQTLPEHQSSLLDRFFAEGAANAAIPSNAERRSHLLHRLRELGNRQSTLASHLLAQKSNELAFVDSTLKETAVSTDDLLRKRSSVSTAVGGPYVPDRAFDGVFEARDGHQFAALQEHDERLKMVTNVLESYPVGKPVEKYYISDRFGSRIDPFTKVRSKHYALDMAGWPGSAIKATAPGTVIYSGWFGPYGNMVEIDHGNGFRTRYGHMRKLSVKKNERVELGQKLGEMGKTGRATGTHLHYEVWFNDKVRDPMPFIKAASNVLKIQGRHEKNYE